MHYPRNNNTDNARNTGDYNAYNYKTMMTSLSQIALDCANLATYLNGGTEALDGDQVEEIAKLFLKELNNLQGNQ